MVYLLNLVELCVVEICNKSNGFVRATRNMRHCKVTMAFSGTMSLM
jgi:hypothetical protein